MEEGKGIVARLLSFFFQVIKENSSFSGDRGELSIALVWEGCDMGYRLNYEPTLTSLLNTKNIVLLMLSLVLQEGTIKRLVSPQFKK